MNPDNPADRPSDRLGATVRIRSFKISLSSVVEARVALECAFFEPSSTAPFWSGLGEGQGGAGASYLRASAVRAAIEGAVDRCVEQSHAQDVNARIRNTASSVSLKKGRASETSGNAQGALDLYAQAYREADDAYQTTEAVKALALLLRKKAIEPPFPEEAQKFRVQANSLLKAHQYDKAIELYEKALDVAPWWAEGHFNRAFILADQNLFPWAIAGMKRYLELAPNDPDARAAQDKIYEWELKVK
jgi:tetratricopeptide (TPR) repeat protein